MSVFNGRLHVPGVVDRPMHVKLDLTGESITITAEEGVIGSWRRDEVHLSGLDYGFGIEIAGVPGELVTSDDGAFAIEIGLRSAPPRLRRLMLAKIGEREADRTQQVVSTTNRRR
jgi:hypothetical protein